MRRFALSSLGPLLIACATKPAPAPLSCQLVFHDDKGVVAEHVALHAIPQAPGVHEHEGIYCGPEVLQGRKVLPQIGALSSEAWIFYLYGDRLAKESRIEARFYPAAEGEKSSRARSVHLASDEPLCAEITKQPLIVPKVRLSGGKYTEMWLQCAGGAPAR